MPAAARARKASVGRAAKVQRVDPREIAQHRFVDRRIERRIVHLLVAADARGERGHEARSKWKPSAARPGPKASATPLPTSGRPISSASTNIRVEEDMLP